MQGVRIGFLVFRILAATWVGLVGIYTCLQWSGSIPAAPNLEPIGWTVSLAIIGLESVGAIVRDKIARSRAERRVDLDRWSLLFVLEYLKTNPDVTFEDIGVSVWVPRRWSRFRHWCRIGRIGRSQMKLARLNRFRPDDYPQRSGLEWTGSMGALGECWRSQKEAYRDNHAIAKRHGGGDLSAEAYERLKADTKHGFTFEQFNQISGKYSEILAVPIWHSDATRNRMIGVLTIDRIYTHDETPKRKLDSTATLRQAATPASLAASTLCGRSS